MPPSNPLAIATSSLVRLVNEEASYHRELEQQTSRLKKMEEEQNAGLPDEDGNREFLLKQERKAVEETKAVFPTLRKKISDGITKLESLLAEEAQKGSNSNVDQINAAKDAISKAKTALRESA
ncbi:hypothetical protein VTN96DRAFT_1393 [Rasamsonia emersonii]|uniref:Tubulin-specific chaperone A n=1 Tax=Rasamsonia emersonii (strain ATCC 16479 / CBS 393.64 / IMI 116815) TaxID=1408163 RepID=A0A0F4YQR4_RASE3|nr:Tubulin-specific chaperone Rbl2 [Rasamsonia emersonii CBS 393.64]KKA20599.1 Tubulin-specific chaperone Rbl2 [Rasamsonia emersonii CBS 393.64]